MGLPKRRPFVFLPNFPDRLTKPSLRPSHRDNCWPTGNDVGALLNSPTNSKNEHRGDGIRPDSPDQHEAKSPSPPRLPRPGTPPGVVDSVWVDPRSRGKWRLRLGGRVVGALKEAGLCEDLALCCRLASAVAKSLDDEEKEWHDAGESELSEFVAQPDRTTARAVPSTIGPAGVECSGTQNSRLCPCKPATVTSVIPFILSGEPRKLVT